MHGYRSMLKTNFKNFPATLTTFKDHCSVVTRNCANESTSAQAGLNIHIWHHTEMNQLKHQRQIYRNCNVTIH